MAASLPIHGVSRNDDLHVNWVRKDTRPWLVKASDDIGSLAPFVVVFGAFLPLALPQYADVLFVIGMVVYWVVGSKILPPPLQAAMRPAPKLRLNPFKRYKTNQYGAKVFNDGILLIGFELGTGRAIVQNDDNTRQHYLVLGTTGSGKTRFILSIIYVALLWNSGAIFVDGKGDSLTFWLIYRICRRLDRTDDLMILNFLNGGREAGNRPSPVSRLSNTNNGWQSSTSSMIVEMIAGMMPSSGGDHEYWRGRARTMVGSVIRLLADLRNRGELALDVQTLRDHMPLSKLMDFAKRSDFDDFRKAGLLSYLYDLGIQEQEIELWGTENQMDFAPKVIEQHGYLTQQLTEILGELGDNLRHIFGVRFGEVHWPTVLYKRKIVFVMLPVLEKSTDTVRGYGRLIFSGIRSALAPALGDTLEGWHDYAMSRKIADSDVPMFLIFDEWGNYATQGAAGIISQVRGLGISTWFLSQDEPGMKKDESLDRETGALMGSSNTKICMLIEEMESTYKLFNMRAHKAYTSKREGNKVDEGSLNQDYFDTGQIRFEEVDRISPRDLVSQGLGEAHITNRDTLLRAQLLYIDPPPIAFARINQWLDAMPTSRHEFDKYGLLGKTASEFFDFDKANENREKHSKYTPATVSRNISALFQGYARAKEFLDDSVETAICGVGFTDYAARKNDAYARQMIAAAWERNSLDAAEKMPLHTDDELARPPQASASEIPATRGGSQPDNQHRQNNDLQEEAKKHQNLFMKLLDSSLASELNNIVGVTEEERQDFGLKGQLKHASYLVDEDADPNESADRSIEAIRSSTPAHPIEPLPLPKTTDEISDDITKLAEAIKRQFGGRGDTDRA